MQRELALAAGHVQHAVPPRLTAIAASLQHLCKRGEHPVTEDLRTLRVRRVVAVHAVAFGRRHPREVRCGRRRICQQRWRCLSLLWHDHAFNACVGAYAQPGDGRALHVQACLLASIGLARMDADGQCVARAQGALELS